MSAKRKDTSSESRSEKKRKSALEEIIEVREAVMRLSVRPRAAVTSPCVQMEERKRKQQQPVRTDYWLQPNIVVKVVTKKLGERYHKRKAVVMVTTRFYCPW